MAADIAINGAKCGASNEDMFLDAVKNQDLEVVKYMIAHYVKHDSEDINMQDRLGNTALHLLILNNYDIEFIKPMFESPVLQCDVPNKDENTPLHVLCQRCTAPWSVELAELLIAKGANINGQNCRGETPLHKIMYNEKTRLPLTEMFVCHKADLNISTNTGETVLHYVTRLNDLELAKFLLVSGAREINSGARTPSEQAGDLRFFDMKSLLERAQEIYIFLSKVGLVELYAETFIKEELSTPVSANHQTVVKLLIARIPVYHDLLLDKLGVNNQEHRAILLKSSPEVTSR